MFSANENVLLRQHKKRIVALVEETIPDECLDLGVQVMVMEVKCQAPGCVPLETVVLIVFPKVKPTDSDDDYLLPGLPQSNGGNFKTKILMPMAQVTKDDVLDALPPQFTGGRRSIPKLALQARDVMLGQITQLFDDTESRQLMAEYLQQQLQEFMNRSCEEPIWGEEYETTTATTSLSLLLEEKDTTTKDATQGESTTDDSSNSNALRDNPALPNNDDPSLTTNNTTPTQQQQQMDLLRNSTKNVVLRRVLDSAPTPVIPSSTTTTPNAHTTASAQLPIESVAARRRQQTWSRTLNMSNRTPLQLLAQREHAPGLRPVGCPCCDPDNPSNVADQFLHL